MREEHNPPGAADAGAGTPKYEFHEKAGIFPLMGDAELAELKADIQANGLREPIWLHDGKVIDGRNRYLACMDLSIQPKYREWDGKGSLTAFIISLNLKRRHLTSSQRACVAVEAEPFFAEEAKKRQGTRTDKHQGNNSLKFSKASDLAAAITKTNPHYVTDAKKLKADSPELFEKVQNGDVTIPQAKRHLKDQEREERREENRQIVANSETLGDAIESAHFATIVVDPPWHYDGDNVYGRGRPPYATMTYDEIEDMPIGEKADVDAHIYLWVTKMSLPKGFALLDAWGFRYSGILTWCKSSFGMGMYFRSSTEHVLFGVRGSQMLKRKDCGTWFEAPRGNGGHSSKPNEFYELVESCSPGPYLDVFARDEREGWTCWGGELPKARLASDVADCVVEREAANA